jgi:Fe-S cluster assembly iron-binding protein IscA
LSYQLALEESADEARDVKLPVDGITFVVEDRDLPMVSGLKIDVQEIYGRKGLVAYNQGFEPGGSCDC